MPESFALEICVDSVEAAVAAQHGGAHRVELCGNLQEGGTTPSAGMIDLVRKNISIGLHVIIRPRGGDFCFSDSEFNVMQRDIMFCKQENVDGIAVGILHRDSSVDVDRMQRLVHIARPMQITFHRAFDETAEPLKAMEDIISLGIERILTSGKQRSAISGLDLIAQLVHLAKNRIIIMPGAGIEEKNIDTILEGTGVREIHVGSAARVSSLNNVVNGNVPASVTDAATVKKLLQTVRDNVMARGMNINK